MTTEEMSSRFVDLDLWPTREAVSAMLEGQLAAAAAVLSQTDAIARAAEDAAARLSKPHGRLIYVGAGTSGRIAVQDGVELGPTYDWGGQRVAFLLAGGMDALLSSIEGAEDDAASGEADMNRLAPAFDDVVVGVAASGRTPYTLAAISTAVASGALTVGIANNAGSPLLDAADHPILLDTGAEVVAGSTRMKAGTAQKIALNLFSTAVMLRLGRICVGAMVDMRVSNRKLRNRAIEMICRLAHVQPPAAETALGLTGGNIKLAVLVALGATGEQAASALSVSGGNLRDAIAGLAQIT